jgi:hypothetical protein
MPRAEIPSKQAMHILTQLHAELAGQSKAARPHGATPNALASIATTQQRKMVVEQPGLR